MKCLGYLVDQCFQERSVFAELVVERFVFYHVELIILVYLVLAVLLVDIVQHVTQGAITTLIDDKGSRIHDRIGKHF